MVDQSSVGWRSLNQALSQRNGGRCGLLLFLRLFQTFDYYLRMKGSFHADDDDDDDDDQDHHQVVVIWMSVVDYVDDHVLVGGTGTSCTVWVSGRVRDQKRLGEWAFSFWFLRSLQSWF